jgi:hypothetical protein
VKIKHLICQATFHNRSELRNMIVDALPSVSSTDAQHWFLHMVQFYNQCALRLPFTGKPLAPTLLNTPAPPVQLHQWQATVSVEAQGTHHTHTHAAHAHHTHGGALLVEWEGLVVLWCASRGQVG